MFKRLRIPAMLVVAIAVCSVPAHASLITNGGFETGNFSGWTQFGNTGNSGVDGSFPSAGTYAAFFGPVGSTGGISQTIATTPGATYTFSFDLLNEAAGTNFFDASFGGGSVLSFTNTAAFSHTSFLYAVIATGSSTAVTFTFRNDPSYVDLDRVAVEQVVPEPSSLLLFATGLAIARGVRRWRMPRS